MEGKGILFKIFADIDVFDLELDTKNVDDFVKIVKALEPTFGGVNLEDIKAPECFEIERRLKEELQIPIMHDDQHGTAIISSAALLNACEIQKKKIDKVKIVVNGAGAAAISCSRLYMSVGAKKENIVMIDRAGVINQSRENLDPTKAEFATSRKINTLEEAIKDADVFIGLSSADVLSPAMLKTMAKNPIVFAMANPDPEIDYNLAIKTRKDVLMATGRSDFPNQVNNVLGFPYIKNKLYIVLITIVNTHTRFFKSKLFKFNRHLICYKFFFHHYLFFNFSTSSLINSWNNSTINCRYVCCLVSIVFLPNHPVTSTWYSLNPQSTPGFNLP
jgi:malate dehydrogenase (oxaloacetate-decarboxylating)(NADP+)